MVTTSQLSSSSLTTHVFEGFLIERCSPAFMQMPRCNPKCLEKQQAPSKTKDEMNGWYVGEEGEEGERKTGMGRK